MIIGLVGGSLLVCARSDILWPVLVVPPAPASITRTETEEREEEKKEKKERGAGDGAAVQEGARRRKHKASKQH